MRPSGGLTFVKKAGWSQHAEGWKREPAVSLNTEVVTREGSLSASLAPYRDCVKASACTSAGTIGVRDSSTESVDAAMGQE